MRHKIEYGFIAFTILVILCQPLSQPYDFFTDLAILVLLLICACMFLVQLVLCIREKFNDKQRAGLLLLIPFAFALFPLALWGLPEGMRRNDAILKANREGAANCMTYFELKKGNKFDATAYCFGTLTTSGSYHLKGDTIFLTNVRSNARANEPYYKFGLIKTGIYMPSIPSTAAINAELDTAKYLHLYQSYTDSTPLWLHVSYNAVFD